LVISKNPSSPNAIKLAQALAIAPPLLVPKIVGLIYNPPGHFVETEK